MPVSCQPARTQPGPAYTSDCIPAATTHTVPALPSMTLSVEPVPTQFAFTGPTATQPALTLAQHALTLPRPVMNEHAPRPVTSVNECTLTVPRPVIPGPTMNDCTHTMPQPTWPVQAMNEHALTTPRPTVPGLAECTHTVSTPALARPTTSDSTVPMHVMSQSTVPGPTSPEVKPQPCMSSLVVHPSTPPAPAVTQPQAVLIKQFQQPKPYSGATSWKGYREYFERLAAVNGWATP